jgi:transposase InsO family protein
MKYRFIEDEHEAHDTAELCEALEVSQSAYYGWRDAEPSAREQDDEHYKERILWLHKQAKGSYGHRPIYEHLQEDGFDCGRDRTLRLMKEMNIEGLQKKRFKPFGTDSAHAFGYSPNLFKALGNPTQCNQVWVADTTYLETRQGWMYLATVMDLFSRRIIGWSISWHNDTDLVCQALKAAVLTRGSIPDGIIHHSDRGSTYASHRYQRLLNRFKMNSSMSAKGNCYDNAAMESFYGRYKTSAVRGHVFVDENQLRANVFNYIEVFYNRFRKHSSLGYKNPMQVEAECFPRIGDIKEVTCTTHN